MNTYFNCHTHTMYSNIRILDCINHPKDVINKAIELGLSGIAITDHECLSAHPEINKIATELQKTNPDFRIALGNEIYLVDERKNGQKYYHFILLAKDAIGYQGLQELSSTAWYYSYVDKGMERVPLLKQELQEIMQKYTGHIIATSACAGGELSTLALRKARMDLNQEDSSSVAQEMLQFTQFCQNIFHDDFYIECAPSTQKDQILINQTLARFAKLLNIKMVVGTDAHYLTAQQRPIHKAYLNSKNGEREIDSFYEFTYLMDYDEINSLLNRSFEDDWSKTILNNTLEIQDKIEYYNLFKKQTIMELEVKDYPKKDLLKEYPVLHSMLQSDNKQERYWVNQCLEALTEKNKYLDTYLARLEEEADTKRVIGEKLETCMFAYPNTLQHYIDLFWECGSIVGAGRGSSCSGLNHYLMGITQLDPLEWDLPWFRYMNKERTEIGDIDLDLSPSKRPLIIQKIKEERSHFFNEDLPQWVKDNLGITLIATFGTEQTKSSILAACFKKGTKVDTIDGEKNIEDVQAGDIVKTANGYEPVIAPTIYTSKPSYCIKTKNAVTENFFCTPEHELLVIDKTRKIKGILPNIKDFKNTFPEIKTLSSTNNLYILRRNNFKQVTPKWVQAKDIENKYYGLTLIDDRIDDIQEISWKNNFYQRFGIGISEHLQINNDFCELIGLWLAEGSINKAGNTVSFTINQKEEALTQRIVELMWKVFSLDNVCITDRTDSAARTIAYSSSQLASFFLQFFDNTGIWREKRADNSYHYLTQWDKKIPSVLKYIDPKKQLQIFKGWFLGDGYARSKNLGDRVAKGTTVSKQLAKDMINILHRNFINPSVDFEARSLSRNNLCDCYNISLYGDYATYLYNYKYVNQDFSANFEFPAECARSIDIPVIYNSKLYMKTKIQASFVEDTQEEMVYCLKMPNGNFSVNNTIVHNCRGYRSEEYPNGIDVDEAQYLTSLVPSERGFLWPIQDVVYGNPEKDRKPIKDFIREINKYPGLLDIIISISSLVNKRSSHASGVVFFEKNPFENSAFMKTPKGEIITQYDLHQLEFLGNTKYDFLVTEVQDKIATTIQLLQEDNVIDPKLSLREAYNQYLHPEILPIDDPKIWKALENNSVLNVFQFDSDVGIQAAQKIKPKNIIELTDANGLMRLMGDKDAERPLDKYVRFKNDISLWYKEMADFGLTPKEQKILEPYFKSSYGVPPS